jgi:hypothetical protein
MMLNALRSMAFLCVLASLASCGLLPPKPQVLTRPQVVEVATPVYRPVPIQLTLPIAEPPQPAARCALDGKPVVCVLDALGVIPSYQAALQQCNDDRANAALLGSGDGQK